MSRDVGGPKCRAREEPEANSFPQKKLEKAEDGVSELWRRSSRASAERGKGSICD